MEIRLNLDETTATYIKALAKTRGTSASTAINRLILEVINQGGIAIVDHVRPENDDQPPL